jgi:hypothetical protein
MSSVTTSAVSGSGAVRASEAEEVTKLLALFRDVSLDWVHRSVDQKCDVFEWVIRTRSHKLVPITGSYQ